MIASFNQDYDGDGNTTEGSSAESSYGNRNTDWTPVLLQAAHNDQLAHTEPGAWAHNFDSIGDVGGLTEALERP
jgi:hypothetical protein